ncbi:MAG: hypothetical protein CTY33_03760 [Methylotenera sp.]|nr:MAG: hypothetical protein CTY33_03760 [Methylotenera sp.]
MKLLSKLLTVVLTASALTSFAATTNENTDDASNLGTAESPQIKKQMERTDKGSSSVNQGATEMDDASDLGTAESPQIKKQMDRTNKGASEPVKKTSKNKVMRKKEADHGTTKGNKVQPSELEQAAPLNSY